MVGEKMVKNVFRVLPVVMLTLVLTAMSFVCFKRNLYFDLGNMLFSVVFAFLLNKKIVLSVCRTLLDRIGRRGTKEKNNDSDL